MVLPAAYSCGASGRPFSSTFQPQESFKSPLAGRPHISFQLSFSDTHPLNDSIFGPHLTRILPTKDSTISQSLSFKENPDPTFLDLCTSRLPQKPVMPASLPPSLPFTFSSFAPHSRHTYNPRGQVVWSAHLMHGDIEPQRNGDQAWWNPFVLSPPDCVRETKTCAEGLEQCLQRNKHLINNYPSLM